MPSLVGFKAAAQCGNLIRVTIEELDLLGLVTKNRFALQEAGLAGI